MPFCNINLNHLTLWYMISSSGFCPLLIMVLSFHIGTPGDNLVTEFTRRQLHDHVHQPGHLNPK